jgi:mono/diheme cytochrome c family protein
MKLAVLALLLLVTPASAADDVAIALGKALAQKNCTTCHAIGPDDKSLIEDAPPFRDIAVRYDIVDLEDSLNEGVATEHPLMPNWQMTPEQAHALASFIMSLAPAGKLKSESETGSQPFLAERP